MYIYWPHEKFMANVVPMSESVAKLKEEKEREEERRTALPPARGNLQIRPGIKWRKFGTVRWLRGIAAAGNADSL